MKTSTLRRALLVAASSLSIGSALQAGLMNPALDLQTYRDYAENRGVFKAGATNVTVYNADGSVSGVIAVVPDFSMVNDNGNGTLVGYSFAGTVAHMGTLGDNQTFGARFNNTGLSYAYFGDSYHPIAATSPGNDVGLVRYSKLVIDAAPAPLTTDTSVLTSMTGKTIARVGGGHQQWALAPGIASNANPGGQNYWWLTGGQNKIDSQGSSTVTDNVNDGVTKTYSGYSFYYNMDAAPAAPLQIGTEDGDSGSPVFYWNATTGRYEVLAFNSVGGGEGIGKSTGIVTAPAWMTDMMASYNMPTVSATSGGGVVTMSVTNASGAGTLTQGGTTWNYLGLANGTTSSSATDAQLEAARNLVFAGAGNTIRLAGSVDTGAGTMEFASGSYIIDDGGVTTRRLNTAGYIVDAGASLTLRITGSAGDDWRKVGTGTLAVEGTGNSDAKLSLGEGLVTLNRSGGYAVDDVLITSGRGTVRLLAANQINGDISFGHLGGTLDLYGQSLSRDVIYAMDSGATIANTKANTTSTFTWTGSGSGATQTFRGGFTDGGSLANGLLNVVINPATASGSVLTLTGESSNAGGYAINGGEVVLRGYNTIHAGEGGLTGAAPTDNPPTVPTPDDWTYASIATGTITVASGAKFTLADHARLDGNVTVNAGGTFAITENLFKASGESVEGGAAGTPSSALYGHQSGAVLLNGSTAAMIATISGNTDQNVVYSRNITGTGSFTKNGPGSLTLSGTNTFSGTKTLNGGTLLGSSLGALGDTTTNQWNLTSGSAVIGATGATAAQVKAKVASGATGTLALAGTNPDAAPDLSGYAGLSLGAIGAQSVGTSGTTSTLAAWDGTGWNLGGGGGVLTMNLKLSGAGTLDVGNGVNTGRVVLTNANNATASGGAAFTGTVNVNAGVELVATSAAALGTFSGSDRIAVAYGARFGVGTGANATTLFNAVTTASQGVVMLSGTDTNAYSFSSQGLNALALGADGTATYSGTLTPGTGGYRFGGDGTLTVSSALSGSYALSADGQGSAGGVTMLSGNNTFTGTVTVQGGVVNGATGSHTLRLGSNSALGASTNAVTLNDGALLDMNGKTETIGALTGTAAASIFNASATAATLTVNSGTSSVFAGTLADGAGLLNLVKSGAGVLTLSGDNTRHGSITINGGGLSLGSATALGQAGNTVTVSSGGYLDLNGNNVRDDVAVTIAGTGPSGTALANSSTVSKGYVGDVTLSGNATISNTSSQKALVLGSSDAQIGTLNLAGYTLTKAGTGTLTLNGLTLNGAGNIVVNAGILQVFDDYGSNQQNTTIAGTGSITLNSGGRLNIQRWGATLSMTMDIVLNGGTLGSAYPGPNNAMLASDITLAANGTFDFNGGGGYGNVTLSGVISGTGNLTVAGDAATRTFSGANTYTGDTTVTAGTLKLSNALALQNSTLASGRIAFDSSVASHAFTFGGLAGSGNISLTDTASNAVALTVGGNNRSTSYSGILSGTGSLTKTGTGEFTLSGANTYSGGTTLAGGTVRVSGSDTVFGTGVVAVSANTYLATASGGGARIIANALSLASGTTLGVDGGFATLTLSGVISGPGALTRSSSGTVVLAANNTYSGTTTNNGGGTLQIGAAGTSGTLGTGAVTNNGSLVFNRSDTLTVSNAISGTGSLTHAGTGALTLTGTNTYSGGTTIVQGRLNATASSLGTGTITVGAAADYGSSYASGGMPFLNLTDTGNATLANALALPAPGAAGYYALQKAGTGSNLTLSGVISGGGANMVLQLDSPTAGDSTTNFTLSGNNTFAGQLRLNRGYLTLGNANGAGSATIYLSSNTNAAGNIRFAGGYTVNNALIVATSGNTVSSSGYNVTWAGTISGASNWTKTGAGTLTLTGTNTYTGVTTVNAGTLAAGSNAAFGTGGVVAASGGTLSVGALGAGRTLANAITVNAGGVLTGSATLTGGVTLASGASFLWSLSGTGGVAGTDYARIAVTGGTATLTGSVLAISAAGIDYTAAYWNTSRSFDVVTKSGSGVLTGGFASLDTSGAGSFSAEGSWSLTTGSGGTQTAVWTAGSSLTGEAPQAVPEPSTYGLAGAATLAAVALVRRRRRARL